MNYQQATSFLEKLEKFGIKLGLEQTAELFRRSDSPDKKLKFIHLAGTNGKGSCAAMIEGALRHCGFKTGMYTSPHLISPCERIRINGRAISEEDFAVAVSRLQSRTDGMVLPTYFEFMTVMAAQCFAEAGVDFVIWETGMGGRFDSTNVVNPLCCAITGIALDHQKYLGSNLSEIAFEKAGIIKYGKPVFCAEVPDEAATVISACAKKLNVELKWCKGDISDVEFKLNDNHFLQSFYYQNFKIELSLPGIMQRRNLKVVFEVLKYLSDEFGFNLQLALSGLCDVRWPARIQFLKNNIILDGAHNPDGASALADALEEIFPNEKLSVIFANFADKDTLGVLHELNRIAAEFIFIPLKIGDRSGCPPEDLLKMHCSISDCPASLASSIKDALKISKNPRTLIAGSLFLAGQIVTQFCSKEKILNLD
ncbi:MAG: bifunctional folylpolyglutamate synthase/dihydrofolate synthase [Victivallaceae bacterium]|nr:bifunctional folylpolyglutamate synthase/dihydrofolate synthase [Victivallaceae bacterium]